MGPLKRRPGFGPPEPPGFGQQSGPGQLARPGEFQLMRHLGHVPAGTGPRVGDLAEQLGIKPPSVSQLVDALEAKGLVERYADDADRRAIRIRLSPSGREMAAAFHEQAMAEVMALVEYLGDDDGELFAVLLAKVSAFFAQRFEARAGHDHCPSHDRAHGDSDKGVE